MAKGKQTLSVGSVLEDRYRTLLGGFSGVMAVDPTCNFMLIAGRTGSGKTSFFHSCSDAFVINADCSSTPSRASACIWPGVRSDGLPVEVDPSNPSDEAESGMYAELSWERIREKKELLIQMAKDNVQGRPKIVVLDTVDSACPLIAAWMIEQWNEKHPENQKSDFFDIGQGQQYREFEQELLSFALDLRHVGYGVAMVFHLGDRAYYENRQRCIDRNVCRVRDQVWNTIIGLTEVVAQFDMTEELDTIKVKRKNRDGSYKRDTKGKIVTRDKDVKRRVVIMRVGPSEENPDANEDIKSRYRHLPTAIKLDNRHPWKTYEDAVRKAIATEQAYTES